MSNSEFAGHAVIGLVQFIIMLAIFVAASFMVVAFWSSSAVLYWESPRTSAILPFECHYATGTRTVIIFSASIAGCARWIEIANE